MLSLIPLALPTHLLIIDVEATCDDQGSVPPAEAEIIEFGCVMTAGFKPVSEFACFVRPVRHPRLYPFCTELTSITQAQVDGARGFVEVMAELKKWTYSFEDVGWGSWGDYDKNQVERECQRAKIPNPMPHRHLNVKKEFTAALALKKKPGMAEALRIAGLTLEGTHHRGIDDARNIARLLPFALGGQKPK